MLNIQIKLPLELKILTDFRFDLSQAQEAIF